jgi:DnaJ-domain-containing protein 1
VIYHDPEQYRLACEGWQRERLLFEAQETERIAQLVKHLTSLQNALGLMVVLYLVAIGIALINGLVHGIGAGVVLFILELIPLAWIFEVFGRLECWRARDELARRTFATEPPTYQPPAYSSPPPRPRQSSWAPPPPPPRRTEPPNQEPTREIRISSLAQACQILGLAPGRITLSEVRAAYRSLMSQYHPDRVSHLGPELRALAARKSVEFNLALQYIKEHTK